MNFENTFLRGDLWIKNVNYSLGISVQSFTYLALGIPRLGMLLNAGITLGRITKFQNSFKSFI